MPLKLPWPIHPNHPAMQLVLNNIFKPPLSLLDIHPLPLLLLLLDSSSLTFKKWQIQTQDRLHDIECLGSGKYDLFFNLPLTHSSISPPRLFLLFICFWCFIHYNLKQNLPRPIYWCGHSSLHFGLRELGTWQTTHIFFFTCFFKISY